MQDVCVNPPVCTYAYTHVCREEVIEYNSVYTRACFYVTHYKKLAAACRTAARRFV